MKSGDRINALPFSTPCLKYNLLLAKNGEEGKVGSAFDIDFDLTIDKSRVIYFFTRGRDTTLRLNGPWVLRHVTRKPAEPTCRISPG
jgi:hypothetical protein